MGGGAVAAVTIFSFLCPFALAGPQRLRNPALHSAKDMANPLPMLIDYFERGGSLSVATLVRLLEEGHQRACVQRHL